MCIWPYMTAHMGVYCSICCVHGHVWLYVLAKMAVYGCISASMAVYVNVYVCIWRYMSACTAVVEVYGRLWQYVSAYERRAHMLPYMAVHGRIRVYIAYMLGYMGVYSVCGRIWLSKFDSFYGCLSPNGSFFKFQDSSETLDGATWRMTKA